MNIIIERTKPAREINVHDLPLFQFGEWTLESLDARLPPIVQVVFRLNEDWFDIYDDLSCNPPLRVPRKFFDPDLKVRTIEGKVTFEIDAPEYETKTGE
jgi:hypothetical protein